MPCEVRLKIWFLNFSEIDTPVRLNCPGYEIWIHPGDIIIGDVDGVVCLPCSLVSDVLKLLPQLVSSKGRNGSKHSPLADERVLEDVRNGASVKDAFQRHRGKI